MVQTSATEATQSLQNFWPNVTEKVKASTNNDFKTQELPLARIKKIMKLDDDVKMISAEAPVLFSKAAELFITELTLRAWIHTEDNKRRTLQRNDIAMAISKYDQFDFLIDIVPRDELKPHKTREETPSRPASSVPDQVQYYLQLAQQNQQALQQAAQPQTATLNASALVGQQQTIQIVQGGAQIPTISVMPQMLQASSTANAATASTPVAVSNTATQNQQPAQIVLQGLNINTVAQQQQQQQQQQQHQQQQQQQQQQAQLGGGIQIVQQIVGPNGEVQQIPLQLSPQQLQMIRMQLASGGNGQPIVLQTTQTSQQNQE